jgi:F-type H+-transporting ATPase subunit delta
MAELVTLARPYAKAAFEVAVGEGDLAGWQTMLSIAASIVADEKVCFALSSPALTSEQSAAILIGICGESLSIKGQNLVRSLAVNKRLPLLPAISKQFSELKSQHERTVSVEICTAFPLGVEICERISQALGKKWLCKIKLHAEVDKSLLGGVVIKAGDTVIDASIRGRMLKLAESLCA